jgi:hypothetical protein
MKAFPNKEYLKTSDPDVIGEIHNGGMDLRDYFAAKAMEGLLSTVKDEEWHCDETASISYDMADAMMKARKK